MLSGYGDQVLAALSQPNLYMIHDEHNLWTNYAKISMDGMYQNGRGCHFYCKFYWKSGPKTPYNYSALFWLITFRFHFSKTRKPVIFMISELLDVSMTPKTNIIYLSKHWDTPISSRRISNYYQKICLGNWKTENICWDVLETTGTETSWRSFYSFLKTCNMGSITLDKREMEMR